MFALKWMTALMAMLVLTSMVHGAYLFTYNKCYPLKNFNPCTQLTKNGSDQAEQKEDLSTEAHKAIGSEMVVYNSFGLPTPSAYQSSKSIKSEAGDSILPVTVESDFVEFDGEASMDEQLLAVEEPVKRKCCSMKTILTVLSATLLGLSSLLLITLPCLFALSLHHKSLDTDDVADKKSEFCPVAVLEELLAGAEQSKTEELSTIPESQEQGGLSEEIMVEPENQVESIQATEEEKTVLSEEVLVEPEAKNVEEVSSVPEFDQRKQPKDRLEETEVAPAFTIGEFLKQLRLEAAKPTEDLLEMMEDKSSEAKSAELPKEPVKAAKPKPMKKRVLKKQRLAAESLEHRQQTESDV